MSDVVLVGVADVVRKFVGDFRLWVVGSTLVSASRAGKSLHMCVRASVGRAGCCLADVPSG